jgi:hypothetical protein
MFQFVLFAIIFLTLNSSQAQWQPDVRLTNSPGSSKTSDNNARCIASSGEAVHIVWADNRNGNYEIYYKRSMDRGTTWDGDVRLTNNIANSILPSLAIENSVIHVVFQDDRHGYIEIFYVRSTDGGISWDNDLRLTESLGYSRNPTVAFFESNVHVVWRDNRDGNYEVYYKRSTDLGNTWEIDRRLTNDPDDSYNPSISLSDSLIHLAWQDGRAGNNEIFYKRSTDNGVNWTTDTRLTFNIGISYNPVITVSPSALHVIFRDSRFGEYDIFYLRSTDEGITWEGERMLTHNTADSLVFTVAASGSALHMVWEDDRDGNYEIYYKRSLDEGVSWEQDTRLTNDAGFSFYAFVSAADSVVHVLWYDNRDGNNEIYYKRNMKGNSPVQVQNINAIDPYGYSLFQNYPNPFNPMTVIRYSLSDNRFVLLKVYDANGRQVKTLVNDNQNKGTYEIDFDGTNLSSGIYFYKITAGDFHTVRRMLLVK